MFFFLSRVEPLNSIPAVFKMTMPLLIRDISLPQTDIRRLVPRLTIMDNRRCAECRQVNVRRKTYVRADY